MREIASAALRTLRGIALAAVMVLVAGCARDTTGERNPLLPALVKSGQHSDLRWAEFTDFRPEIERLYVRAA